MIQYYAVNIDWCRIQENQSIKYPKEGKDLSKDLEGSATTLWTTSAAAAVDNKES